MVHRSNNRWPARATLSAVLGAGVTALLAAGCANSGDRACLDHAECASGLCLSDGTCAPAPDGGSAHDGTPSSDADGDGGLAGCRPDHDGVVARDEISLAAGRTATFRVALDTTVDTAGQLETGGARSWDLTGPYDGDDDVLVELLPLAGTWYEESFPGASYATRLSQTEQLLGVFELTDDALLLRGVVSPQAGAGRTELTYDPPIVVLELPLSSSSSWSTSSTVSGVAQGVAAYYSEEYEQRVDAVGELDTPYGAFPVQRVRVELTRTVGAAIVTLRSLSFVAECFGIVGQVSSHEYETDPEFTDAAELRRLAP